MAVALGVALATDPEGVAEVARSPVTFGVGLCVVASGLTSLGLVVQKLSHVRNDELASEFRMAFYLQWLWWLGFMTFVAGQIGNLVALSYAPATLLACLGSTSVMCNIVLANIILGERMSLTAWPLMAGVVSGGVLLVVTAPAADPDWVVGDGSVLLLAFGRPLAILWMVIAAVSVMLLTPGAYNAPGPEPFRSPRGADLTVEAQDAVYERTCRAALHFVALAALAAGLSSVLFRGVSLMLVSPHDSPWSHPSAWILTTLALMSGLVQVLLLNRALAIGEALIVVPGYYALGMVVQLISAALYFEEVYAFELTAWRTYGFISGVLVTLLCTVMLGRAEVSERAAFEPLEGLDHPFTPARHREALKSSPHETTKLFDAFSDSENVTPTRHYSLDSQAFEGSFPGRNNRVYTVGVVTPGFA